MILILGCGLTGISVARYLYKNKIGFIIADNQKKPPLKNKLPKCQTHFGIYDKSILNNINKIIISPGIKPSEKIVNWAIKLNIEIINDIDLFYQANKNKIFIGITGSNGKSTTTKLLEFVLQKLKLNVIACGNIGIPVLEVGNHYDIFILELSSYQLDYIKFAQLNYGVILNISTDHLDRYKTLKNYTKSKLKIHKISKHIIVNRNNKFTNNLVSDFINAVPKTDEFGTLNCHNGKFIIFNDKVILNYKDCKLFGEHNLENILAVFSICQKLKLNLTQVAVAITQFSGLEHRLEFVKNIIGIDFYNDSKATNSTSTIIAINTLQKKYTSISLILGGELKNENYKQLIDLINQKIQNVILIGSSTKYFKNQISVPISIANNLKKAVIIAKKHNNQCVLLSPACASFDQFDNFEHRGTEFKKWC